MKPYTYSIFAALFAAGFAQASVTATTTPVGYVSLGDTTVGQPAVKAGTDVSISIPLSQPTQFRGLIGSVAGSVITISGTPALGDLTTFPHVVKIESGARSGLVALITASTTNTVTVAVQSGDDLTGVTNTDTISISNAWTVAGLLGTSLPVNTSLLGFSGTSTGQNLAADLIWQFDGTNWIDTNTFNPADNAVLYPGETLILRNDAVTPITSLVVSGEVSTSNSRLVVQSAAVTGTDNMISFVGAASQVIGTSGLSAIAHVNDEILANDNSATGENKAAVTAIQFDGTDWIDTNSFDTVTSTFKLEPGVGYTFRTDPSHPVGSSVWTSLPDFVPSL